MGSTRLPGKSMMDLAGAPLVGRILERVKRVKKIDKIVLATTELEKDDVLVELAKQYNVFSFRGSELDLVDRFYKAAKYYNADVVLRLPADNPCPEPEEYNKLISYHIKSGNDFSSNITNFMNNNYPDGIGIEAFSFSSLEYIWQNEKDPYKRDFLAMNYYDYLKDELPKDSKFKVGTIKCNKSIARPDLVLDVNTKEQFDFISKLYKDIYPNNPKFTIYDIIEWYDKNYN